MGMHGIWPNQLLEVFSPNNSKTIPPGLYIRFRRLARSWLRWLHLAPIQGFLGFCYDQASLHPWKVWCWKSRSRYDENTFQIIWCCSIVYKYIFNISIYTKILLHCKEFVKLLVSACSQFLARKTHQIIVWFWQKQLIAKSKKSGLYQIILSESYHYLIPAKKVKHFWRDTYVSINLLCLKKRYYTSYISWNM